ncbi:MAG: S41 family peptidase [Clostridia bacterium]|nr:S41 family peptidase [Clostridia bacterium]
MRQFTEEACIKAIVKGLADKYSQYYNAQEYTDLVVSAQGNMYGIGVSLGNDLQVKRVAFNSPLDKACRNAGFDWEDKFITAIDSKNEGKQAVNDYTKFTDVLYEYARGENFNVYIDDVPLNVSREAFVESYVRYFDKNGTLIVYYDETAKKVDSEYVSGEILKGAENFDMNTALVKFNEFNGNAFDEMQEALNYFSTHLKKNLILDLRNNGGGYMDILTRTVSLFVNEPAGSLVTVAKYKDGHEEKYPTDKNRFVPIEKLYLLANENSASASECLIGALLTYGTLDANNFIVTNDDYTDGNINATYGKGIMQTTFIAPYSTALKITTAFVYWPDETTNIHGVGIKATAENSCAYADAIPLALSKI